LGPAEKLLEIVGGEERKEGFLDLVTVAQAFHWFEEDVFLSQAMKGLKSGGVLSISVYGPKMHFTNNTEASDLLYGCWSRLKSWADWGSWFESHYATLEGSLLDFHNQQSNLGGEFCDVKRHQLRVSRSLTWNQIVSFVKSWAILNIYKHANPQAVDPSIEALAKLKLVLRPENDDMQQFVIEWELSLILARKK
jgi:hypothetical protein